MSKTYHSLAGGSLTQNWSNTDLITATDNWVTVPSIEGFLGDINAASPTDVDPRTLTGEALGAIDIIANQATPNSNTTGGVAEFDGIADPTVALQGSGTADAPSLVLHLDATGRENVRVQFNARDIDGSGDNAPQQLNVQYRIGETGTWTNVPGGYLADVTTGPSATQTTAIDVTLPADVNNQPQVQVRIMTTNAVGSDEWVGIDDINVSSSPADGSTPVSVSISDASITEGDAGTQVLTFTVTRSDNTGDFTVDYTTANGSATAGSDFVGVSGAPNTIAFTAGGPLTQQVSIVINGDTALEADETFTVNLGNLVNSSGTAEIGDGSATGTILNDDVTRISSIQGTSHISPLLDQVVTTRGVVTAVDTNGSRGFYIQDPNGDGNAATSDAIFVFVPSGPLPPVGHLVEVTGTVSEFTASDTIGTLSTTELTSITNLTDLGVGPAITATVIGGPGGLLPPTESLIAGNTFYEKLEGMLVTVQDAVVVGPTNDFGEIFTVVDNDSDPTNGLNATGQTDRGNLHITPGNPDFGDTNTSGGDFNPERIQIDDDNGVLSGFVSPDVNVGARLADVTGIVNYDFGNYQVVATQAYTVAQQSTLTKETGTLTGDANHLLVASYNAENLDPTDGTARFQTIAAEILNNLRAPDVIALQEVQDNDGVADTDDSSADVTLQMLVDELNAAAPDGVEYAFIDNPFIGDDTNGGQPGGNIRTAYLYRTDRVDFVEDSLATIGADGSLITDPTGNTDQQQNPDNPFYESRPPLVATFTFNGQDVTIVNNHLTSKTGSAPLFGSDQPPFDAGEVSRAAQAQALNNFVDSMLASDPNAKVIVAGDLNEFPNEEPMAVLRGEATVTNYDVPGDDPFFATADYTAGGSAVLADLLETLPEDERYDYVFEGNSQTLDHVLVTEGLTAGVQFDVVRINAEFADQTSDHDPLVASFLVEQAVAPNYRLQILHASDFEAGLAAIDDAPRFAAIVDRLEDLETNSITLASGDNYIASPFFNASSDPSLDPFFEESVGRADIRILNTIGFEASVIGNHEFDSGPREVRNLIRPAGAGDDGGGAYEGTLFPYLAANLDFSGEPDLAPNASTSPITEATFGTGANGGLRLGASTIIEENGERIGVVGVTTPVFEDITTPGGVRVIGPHTLESDADFEALAAIVQQQIDVLTAQGVNKIILVSQLQELENEARLISFLHDVDVVVAGGSNTLLSDSTDVLREGDVSQGEYAQLITNGGGGQTVLVNTDGNYEYVGRLVLEFDAQGNIIPESLNPNINGAYATDQAGLERVYEGSGIDPFEEGSKGDTVRDITTVIDNVISVKDAVQFGRTDVYLDGRRGEVRSQETNLGNLSADANLWYAQQTDDTVTISIKNGGGIRDSIGTIGAGGVELPPAANPDAGKEVGEVSQLDIENSLRFNNALSLVTLTPEQLLEALENGVSNPGAIFAQIGGLKFSYDPTQPAGNRVQTVALVDEAGEVTDIIVENGEIVADAPPAIRMVTLTFLIGVPTTGGGFTQPDGFRFAEYIAANPEFANRVDLDPDASGSDDVGSRTGAATFTDNGREQDAFAEYMAAKHSVTPYAEADTPQAQDERIQNLAVRDDTIAVNDAPEFTSPDAFPMAENQTAVGTVTATDPEDDPFTFAIAGGDDAEFFVIDPNTGALRFVNSPDFETREDDDADGVYEVIVSATDDGGEASTQAISVSVTNVNEPGRTFNGGNRNDTFVGTTGNDRMDGDNGNDNINGNDGNDEIEGGSGNDILAGGRGHDEIEGESGNDELDGGLGNDELDGGSGRDMLAGGEGNDELDGGSDDDVMDGDAGNDDLDGSSGNDLLSGGDGNDDLDGDSGRDTLIGGAGNDRLTGGSGDDLFAFSPGFGKDVITDFRNDDRIVMDDAVFQNFQELRAAADQVGRNVVITVDADNTITLQDVRLNSLHANDFLFV
jgi:predicted extracellular nuclease/2',3'-cyclic-nucleotide 2'-phosphodiesterase (5'-nucleotidase family)